MSSKKRKTYNYYESVLTEEDKRALVMYNQEIDKIYSKAHDKTLIIKAEERKKRKAEAIRVKNENIRKQEKEIRDKIEAFPENLEKIKKIYFETIFEKNHANLLKEINKFKQKCIHPKVFKTTAKVQEYSDSGGGQGPGIESVRTVLACGLCRNKLHISNFHDYTIESERFIDIVNACSEWREKC